MPKRRDALADRGADDQVSVADAILTARSYTVASAAKKRDITLRPSSSLNVKIALSVAFSCRT